VADAVQRRATTFRTSPRNGHWLLVGDFSDSTTLWRAIEQISRSLTPKPLYIFHKACNDYGLIDGRAEATTCDAPAWTYGTLFLISFLAQDLKILTGEHEASKRHSRCQLHTANEGTKGFHEQVAFSNPRARAGTAARLCRSPEFGCLS
jgi:hypothetical protein